MQLHKGSAKLALLVGGVLAGILLAGLLLRHTLSAFLTALVLAYLINPLLKRLEKRGLSRLPAIALLYLLLLAAAVGVSLLFLPYVGHQLDALGESLPSYVQRLKGAVEQWRDSLSLYYSDEEMAWFSSQMDAAMGRAAAEISGKGYERLKGVLFGVFNIILAPVMVFFMLYYKDTFKVLLLRYTPTHLRHELIDLGKRINRTLERFVLAMLFDCLLVGILCSIALYALGIEFSLLNGMLAGFATVVPFVGAIVAVIPPAVIGYAQSGDLTIIPKICALYFLINVVIEGNLIKPLVMRGTLKLNPLWVIFSVMAMGELMGFWGIVLAIPLAAVVKICAFEIKDFIRTFNSSPSG
ncbi:MAG: AI-2E family transporter [Geobacter sp.]|nr:AI-2E family transporter [Geobacter sp.]